MPLERRTARERKRKGKTMTTHSNGGMTGKTFFNGGLVIRLKALSEPEKHSDFKHRGDDPTL